MMIDSITDKFEKAMKKGFISTLVLMILDEEPSHGYQIIKKIEERSLGVWKPNVSTMYTILKDLKTKELIRLVQDREPEDSKKVYELTNNGRKALKIMREKELIMRESLQHLILETSDDSSISEFNDPSKFFLKRFFALRLDKKTNQQKIEILTSVRSFMKRRIEMFNQRLQSIDEQLSKLENEKVN